jgi:hypothetical protein
VAELLEMALGEAVFVGEQRLPDRPGEDPRVLIGVIAREFADDPGERP